MVLDTVIRHNISSLEGTPQELVWEFHMMILYTMSIRYVYTLVLHTIVVESKNICCIVGLHLPSTLGSSNHTSKDLAMGNHTTEPTKRTL